MLLDPIWGAGMNSKRSVINNGLALAIAVGLVVGLSFVIWAIVTAPSASAPEIGQVTAEVDQTPVPAATATSAQQGYPEPGLPTVVVVPTEALPTETLPVMPTPEPIPVTYTLTSTSDWEVFSDPSLGLSFRYPPASQTTVGLEDGTDPIWTRVIVSIPVDNAQSGFADTLIYVQVGVYPNSNGWSLTQAVEQIGNNYGRPLPLTPEPKNLFAPELYAGVRDRLASLTSGNASLYQDRPYLPPTYFAIYGGQIYVIGFGLEMLGSPTELDVRTFATLMDTLTFTATP